MTRRLRAPLRYRIRQLACTHPGDWEITFAQYMGVADLTVILARCPHCGRTITARPAHHARERAGTDA